MNKHIHTILPALGCTVPHCGTSRTQVHHVRANQRIINHQEHQGHLNGNNKVGTCTNIRVSQYRNEEYLID